MVTGLVMEIVLTLSVVVSLLVIVAATSMLWTVGYELRVLTVRTALLQRKIGDAALLLR